MPAKRPPAKEDDDARTGNDPGGEEASRLIAMNEAMKAERANTMILWDDCARYILQHKGQILTKYTPGQNQTINVYDTTASEAAGVAASGILTHIMPAGEKWFQLSAKAKGHGHKVSPAVQSWFDELTDVAISQIHSSNFYLGEHECLLSGVTFGTDCLFLEQGKKRLLNFIEIAVGTFCIYENSEGAVDVVSREFQYTARQAAQKWGEDNLTPSLAAALRERTPAARNRKFNFIHIVEPREDVDYKGGKVGPLLRPIRSVYICKEDSAIIEEGGYYEMPYFVARMERSNNEVYGRGPGMQSMSEIKMLNAMERDLLTAVEKMVNPPWLVPNSADTGEIESVPNGVTYYDSSVNGAKPEQLHLQHNVDMGEKKTEQKRQRIRDAFWNTLFKVLTAAAEMKREKTAYEVQQMVAEQMVLFSPIFARRVQEHINPLLERVVNIIIREGLVSQPPPEVVNGLEYEIVYTSKIALALKNAQNQSVSTIMTLIQQLGALDPTVTNIVKWQEAARLVIRNVGLPAFVIRSVAEADAMTKAQQQAQAAQQQAETAQTATQAMKNLGPTAQTEASRHILSAAGSPNAKPTQAA